jgi:hypothetical protein
MINCGETVRAVARDNFRTIQPTSGLSGLLVNDLQLHRGLLKLNSSGVFKQFLFKEFTTPRERITCGETVRAAGGNAGM